MQKVFIYVTPEEKRLVRQAAFHLNMSESALAAAVLMPAVQRLLDVPQHQTTRYKDRLILAREEAMQE